MRVPGFSARDRGGDARQQAAAAERRDDRVHVGQVFENLEANGGVAGDELVVVERVDEVAVMRSEPCDSTVCQHSS